MKDRRIHPRVEYQLQFECRQYYDPSGALKRFEDITTFSVDNISAGGLQMYSNTFIPDESVLNFTLYLEQLPYVIMGRIRWGVKVGDVWQYGLEFLTIPNALYRHLREVVNVGVEEGKLLP